jgi:hypothetical protein
MSNSDLFLCEIFIFLMVKFMVGTSRKLIRKYVRLNSNIYFIIGTILIVINIADFRHLSAKAFENNSINAGYIIGSQFLLLFGFLLIRIGSRKNKRLQELKKNEIEQSIEEIGKVQ